jgi:hypothetical protein
MSGAGLHAIFDVVAWLAAGAAGWWMQRVQRAQLHAHAFPSQSFEWPYLAAHRRASVLTQSHFDRGFAPFILLGLLVGVGGLMLIVAAIAVLGPKDPPEPAANSEIHPVWAKSVNQNANKPLIFGVF